MVSSISLWIADPLEMVLRKKQNKKESWESEVNREVCDLQNEEWGWCFRRLAWYQEKTGRPGVGPQQWLYWLSEDSHEPLSSSNGCIGTGSLKTQTDKPVSSTSTAWTGTWRLVSAAKKPSSRYSCLLWATKCSRHQQRRKDFTFQMPSVQQTPRSVLKLQLWQRRGQSGQRRWRHDFFVSYALLKAEISGPHAHFAPSRS